MKEKKTFYRVCSPETKQGLWYDFEGEFTGLIHNEFNFCENSELQMDFDEELIGYLSAVPELEMLWKWFTKEDILKLQEHGFYIHKFEATNYWFYDRFQHDVICQLTSKVIERIVIGENIMCELAMKMDEGHWVVSTILWPKDKLDSLTFDEFKILREFDFNAIESNFPKPIETI